ncbi:hypothetical protein SAMN05421847_0478 [Halpernia humi]|uniref:Uncharacterized protein n=1 Tax=Halpernia humi TaxID=493375 RepID=A0A1H5THN6_9FLAO|nr:hypothetical protein [Halpernia humi]SEF62319.1 hypothetical protein SAMN05421847_0478 [Halpernia humi]
MSEIINSKQLSGNLSGNASTSKFNVSDFLGSSSSSITSVTSLLGPIGQGIGIFANLVPGLDGFLKSGFDFSCLGSQAFDKNNLNDCLKDLQNRATVAQNSQDYNKLAELATFCDGVVRESAIEISRYRSGCSKSLRQKYADAAQSVLDSLDLTKFNATEVTKHNWDGGSYQGTDYKAKQGGMYSTLDLSKITPEIFTSSVVPALTQKALTDGVDPKSYIDLAKNSLFPNENLGSGTGSSTGNVPPFAGAVQIGVDENGNIIWSASATNQPQTNTFLYIILAIVAYLIISKKK